MVNHTQALTSSPSYYRGQYGIAETSRMFGMFQWAKQRKIITLCSLQHWSNGPIAMTCPEFVTEQGPRRRIIGWAEYKEGSSRKRLIGKCKQVEHNEDDRRELQERSGRQDTARRYTPRKPVTEGWTNADLPVTWRGIVLDPESDRFRNAMQANKCPLRMPCRGTVCLRPDRQIDAVLHASFHPIRYTNEERFVFHTTELHEHPYRVASALASTTADLRAAAS